MRSPVTLTRPLLALGAVTAALAVAVPTSAHAARGFESRAATFQMQLKGVQITTWSADESPALGCDGPVRTGRGSERITFGSKWVRAKLTTIGSRDAVAIFGRPSGTKPLELRLAGTVKRSSQSERAPVKPECAVADGNGTGEQPAPPDCGTRKFSNLDVRPDIAERNGRRYLKVHQLNSPKTPKFAECWINGFSWPTLLQHDAKNKNGVVVGFEPKQLFATSPKGSQTWIGRGEKTTRSFGTVSTTKIEWRYTVRKVRRAS